MSPGFTKRLMQIANSRHGVKRIAGLSLAGGLENGGPQVVGSSLDIAIVKSMITRFRPNALFFLIT